MAGKFILAIFLTFPSSVVSCSGDRRSWPFSLSAETKCSFWQRLCVADNVLKFEERKRETMIGMKFLCID
jgi:hypothetical protein